MKAECDDTKKTECAKCEHGSFTAVQNHLTKCRPCKQCSPSNHQRPLIHCSATNNTVCECLPGFYCESDACDHCRPVNRCQLGEGVKTPVNRTSDVICAPCEKGTFSNVTDFQSPCRPHTRCEDYGRVLKIPGTNKTDAVCGNFKSYCPWMLPAGLWSGFVLTAIVIVLLLILWRAKCKSYRAARSSICITPVAVVPIPADTPTELPSHCQETCKFPIFNPDDSPVICSIQDSLPITPLKASVSFAESTQTNGNADYCTSHFFRSYSEPQEDEYCGT